MQGQVKTQIPFRYDNQGNGNQGNDDRKARAQRTMTIPFATMEQKFLVFVYVGVWVVQGGYLAWVAWQWLHTAKPLPPGEQQGS